MWFMFMGPLSFLYLAVLNVMIMHGILPLSAQNVEATFLYLVTRAAA
jgi:hypothetical protein